MQELWTTYGFYLWGLTTALVVVALGWLAWNTFGEPADGETAGPPAAAPDVHRLSDMEERLTALTEAAPFMQATLGRALQYVGLARGSGAEGAQSFAVAVANARGDGFVLSGGATGGLNLKVLANWASNIPLSDEERAAISDAQSQKGRAA